jgi:hypothetical protein
VVVKDPPPEVGVGPEEVAEALELFVCANALARRPVMASNLSMTGGTAETQNIRVIAEEACQHICTWEPWRNMLHSCLVRG